MNVTPRKSRSIVNRFLKSDAPIQGQVLNDVAIRLRRQYRGGEVALMRTLLQKALKGERLFEINESGQTFYEPCKARKKRMKAAKLLLAPQDTAGSSSSSMAA